MTKLISPDRPETCPRAPLGAYERDAVLKRLSRIAIDLNHPAVTAYESAALVREQETLRRALSAAV